MIRRKASSLLKSWSTSVRGGSDKNDCLCELGADCQ